MRTPIARASEPTRVTDLDQRPLKVLRPEQVERYAEDGFLALASLIESDWIERLRRVTQTFVDRARALREPNAIFDLELDHTADAPRLRRLTSPADLHEVYWEFMSTSVIVDLVEDLIGPDIKFHHSKLNFKAPRGGEEVKWHQDIQFWPHTNYGPLTVGVFLEDVSDEMGNVGFIPSSHTGELYDQYDGANWRGCLSDRDVARLSVESAIYPAGPAGTVTVHNCRTVHGSAPNLSARERPLLLQTYAPADAFTYTDLVKQSPRGDSLIRGAAAQWARHDPRPCQVGPSRVRTIFEVQQGDGRRP
jgi:ectoine hydroxylase-related dioxygenase (phytanoyl-CoA dioxygenase family)